MKNKKNIIAISLMVAFIVLTSLLKFVDVRNIGEGNSSSGLSFINKLSSGITYNETLDKISDVFLIVSVLLVAIFAVIGCIQLIKRKSIFKVDREILLFGVSLIIMAVFWIFFEKAMIVNYRPIFIDGELESSYPSTHIMIVSFVCLSSVQMLENYLKKKAKILYIAAILIVVTTFTLRLVSGMHWLTDCVGGVILGCLLYFIFIAFCEKLKNTTN